MKRAVLPLVWASGTVRTSEDASEHGREGTEPGPLPERLCPSPGAVSPGCTPPGRAPALLRL